MNVYVKAIVGVLFFGGQEEDCLALESYSPAILLSLFFLPLLPLTHPPFSLTPIDLAVNGTGSQLRCMGKSR